MGNTAVAVRLSATDRIEQVGVVSFFAMAGVLQFSIAAAQILLAISIACWFALLASGRERFAAPRFFWLLVGYGACTLVSAAFSPAAPRVPPCAALMGATRGDSEELVRIMSTAPAAKSRSPSGFLFMALKIHSPPSPNNGLGGTLM